MRRWVYDRCTAPYVRTLQSSCRRRFHRCQACESAASTQPHVISPRLSARTSNELSRTLFVYLVIPLWAVLRFPRRRPPLSHCCPRTWPGPSLRYKDRPTGRAGLPRLRSGASRLFKRPAEQAVGCPTLSSARKICAPRTSWAIEAAHPLLFLLLRLSLLSSSWVGCSWIPEWLPARVLVVT